MQTILLATIPALIILAGLVSIWNAVQRIRRAQDLLSARARRRAGLRQSPTLDVKAED